MGGHVVDEEHKTCPIGQKEICDKERCAYWKSCEPIITGGLIGYLEDQIHMLRQDIVGEAHAHFQQKS
jgi:hypothetical protein